MNGWSDAIPFRSLGEDLPGPAWRALFEEAWPGHHRRFLLEGDAARPSRERAEAELARHMPELRGTYERLVDLAGGGDLAARFLAHYRPTPHPAGGSQLVWSAPEPILARNYDDHPDAWEAALVRTRWNGTRVVATSAGLWGALDGMNEHGLAVALLPGGRRVVGDGFGLPLVLRYVLELCRTTADAADVLARVPAHAAALVSIVDAGGAFATVEVAPDRPARVLRAPVAASRPASGRFLTSRLADPDETLERLAERFLEEPLFSRDPVRGLGTLYTAVYLPARGEVELRWPERVLRRSLEAFADEELSIRFP